jgi:hypothetical protein
MNRIASATCPRCGAGLQPAPGQEQVICQYCGTTSFVQRAAQPAHPVPRSSSHGALAAVIGVGTLALLGVVSYLVMAPAAAPELPVRPSPPQPVAVPEVTPKTPASAAATTGAKPAPTFTVRGEFSPLVADVNADQTPDIVTQIEVERARHYVVFSGQEGRELARTPALADEDQALAAVVGRRLISASRSGQLTSFGLANGSQQWTTALGERPQSFCSAKSEEALLVQTDDGRRLSIDLTTGRQSETKTPCALRLTRPGRWENPGDRHDYAAPLGTESYHCGGVSVMGSQNYTVRDQCLVKARVDTDRLDGFVGHRLWKVEKNWLAFGIRSPGTYVPMIGLVSRGKLVWKQNVPRDNPLEADTGSPQHVGLEQGLAVAAYAHAKSRAQFVTAFVVADGSRRWHVALPEDVQAIANFVTSANRVFVQGREQLLILDVTDGKLVARVGKGGA